jgi:hypothetical protein
VRYPRALLFLGGTVVASLAVYLFLPETQTVIWHLTHGSSVQLNELQFHVPAFYSAQVHADKSVLYIIAVPGRARNYFKGSRTLKVSMISLHQLSNGQMGQIPNENKDSWAAHDYRKTSNRDLSLAGNSGMCVGYSGPRIWNGNKDLEIFCEFQGGLEAHFAGTEAGVDDFYKVLETAQRQKEKI